MMLEGLKCPQALQLSPQGGVPLVTGLATSSSRARLRRQHCACAQGSDSYSTSTSTTCASAVSHVHQSPSHEPHRRKWQRQRSLQVDVLGSTSPQQQQQQQQQQQMSLHHQLEHLLSPGTEPLQHQPLPARDELDLHYSLVDLQDDGQQAVQHHSPMLQPPMSAGAPKSMDAGRHHGLQQQQQQQVLDAPDGTQQQQQRHGRHNRKWAARQPAAGQRCGLSESRHAAPSKQQLETSLGWASSSTGMDPRILTRKLSTCQSFGALHQAYLEHRDAFNHLHVACAMNRLAKLPAGNTQAAAGQHMLAHLESMFAHQLPQYSVREVANAVWAWAKLSHQPQPSTRQAICRTITARGAALLRAPGVAPQALGNLAYGLAMLGWQEREVWAALTAATISALSKHREQQELTHGASSATSSNGASNSSHHSRPALQAVGSSQQRGQGVPGHRRHKDTMRFAPVDLAGVAWSFAAAKQYNPQLFETLLDVALDQLPDFCAQDLANLLWACATVRHMPHRLFDAATPMVLACIHGFTAQGLANVAWAYGVSGAAAADVMHAVCRHALPLLHAFQPVHFAQLAWAMVRTKQVQPALMRAALASVQADPQRWRTRNLAMLLWSATTCGLMDEAVLNSLQPVVLQRLQEELRSTSTSSDNSGSSDASQHAAPGMPLQRHQQHGRQQPARSNLQDVSQIVWAHASSKVYDPAIFGTAVQLCLSHEQRWLRSPAAFQSLLWSFGYAGHYDERLFRAAAAHVASGLPWQQDGLTASQLAGVLVALAGMQHADPHACAAAAAHISELCRTDPHQLNTETLVNVLWALAMLDHLEAQLLQDVLPVLAARWRTQVALEGPRHRGTELYDSSSMQHESEQGIGMPGPSSSASSSGTMWPGEHAAAAADELPGSSAAGAAAEPSKLPLSQYLFSNKQLGKLFHVCLWLQDVESGHAARSGEQHQQAAVASQWRLLPDDLLAAAQGIWLSQTSTGSVVSIMHQEVHQVLCSMGLRSQLENLSPDGMFSIDCVLRLGAQQVAVEVCGPMHYTRSHPPRMMGSKVLRDRLVARRGYVLLDVPYWEWDALAGDRVAAQHYLLAKLQQVVQGPQAVSELHQVAARLPPLAAQ